MNAAAPHSPPHSLSHLSHARCGAHGKLAITGRLNATLQRLMAMGLVPGAQVTVIRVAPLGDPIMLDVGGYQVSLRRKEAEGLSLETTARP